MRHLILGPYGYFRCFCFDFISSSLAATYDRLYRASPDLRLPQTWICTWRDQVYPFSSFIINYYTIRFQFCSFSFSLYFEKFSTWICPFAVNVTLKSRTDVSLLTFQQFVLSIKILWKDQWNQCWKSFSCHSIVGIVIFLLYSKHLQRFIENSRHCWFFRTDILQNTVVGYSRHICLLAFFFCKMAVWCLGDGVCLDFGWLSNTCHELQKPANFALDITKKIRRYLSWKRLLNNIDW